MGYTHYWKYTEFTKSQWKEIKHQARKIVAATLIPVQYEYNEERPLSESITDECIQFNGVGGDGHETFYLPRVINDWNFCKTAQKPYDEVVVAMLVMLVKESGGHFSWSSDGDPSDFLDGIELYNRAKG